jgi:diguanylate cyclase
MSHVNTDSPSRLLNRYKTFDLIFKKSYYCNTMNFNIYQKVCASFFALLVLFWIGLFASGLRETFYNNFFVFLYGLIPLVGGLVAMKGYREWGGLSTTLGKAILFIGTGLFLWGCGETVWAYYNFFLNTELPYPSVADLFFLPSVFFYTIGTAFLSLTTGARMGMKNAGGKIFAVTAPICVLILTYYLIIVVGHEGQILSDSSSFIKSILDVAYPLGDAVSLAVAFVVAGLSFKYMGGTYKNDVIFILLGLAIMFVADSYLSYSVTVGTAYSGDIGDLLFTTAVFLLTCGVLGFNKIKKPQELV